MKKLALIFFALLMVACAAPQTAVDVRSTSGEKETPLPYPPRQHRLSFPQQSARL